MRDGNFVVGVTTVNQRGGEFLECTAEVAQPTTVYAFTGRGSQEQGMGMDLYNSPPAARAVWNSADAHLISAYGLRERHMEMLTRNATNVPTFALFNTLSRIPKDFILPLNLRRSPSLCHAQPWR
jgi:acyl transferase domain-containing protein